MGLFHFTKREELMTKKSVQIYGQWSSPVSVSFVSQRLRLDDVQWAADGQTLVWAEGRSGSSALVAQTGCEARRDLTIDQSPRGGVGYGGGSFEASNPAGLVVFANRDGRLYRRSLGLEAPRPITPSINAPAGGVAAPTLSPDGNWVVYLYSDGATDLLALVDSAGANWPVPLVRGADFYMQPAWSPRGDFLAWVEWDHPKMPWDGTRVCLARLETRDEGAAPSVQQTVTIGGGPDSPAQQPVFSPDGRWLCFIEETGEWPDLICFDMETQERRVLVSGDGFDLSAPAWVQGVRTLAWSPDSSAIFNLRADGPNTSLWKIELSGGKAERIPTEPYTALSQLSVNPRTGALAFLGAASQQPQQVLVLDNQGIRPVANSAAAVYDPAYLSIPRQITWDTPGGQAFGLYYPPTNPRFEGEGAPPAILQIHGGPTSNVANGFNAEAAYFTSRGYAWVAVNYRGSTAHGRAYRHAMRERWGDVDVEDAASCARALADQGLANPKQMVILGGSAGGYTVLNSLIRYPGLFKAGVCLYGVSNLFALDLDTHKFEAHYNASMVGKLPEAAGRYHAWSPVFHAAAIRDALYIFQGSEDKVVPPSQSEEIIARLKERGIPYQYRLYEGEGHGFRKSETIADYLKETERFLQQYVLFAP
jgi:dipeptidyl aminopeptidase/acylaminoacyl peptidase